MARHSSMNISDQSHQPPVTPRKPVPMPRQQVLSSIPLPVPTDPSSTIGPIFNQLQTPSIPIQQLIQQQQQQQQQQLQLQQQHEFQQRILQQQYHMQMASQHQILPHQIPGAQNQPVIAPMTFTYPFQTSSTQLLPSMQMMPMMQSYSLLSTSTTPSTLSNYNYMPEATSNTIRPQPMVSPIQSPIRNPIKSNWVKSENSSFQPWKSRSAPSSPSPSPSITQPQVVNPKAASDTVIPSHLFAPSASTPVLSSEMAESLTKNSWMCPGQCGKILNKRSFRSIKKHKQTCVYNHQYLSSGTYYAPPMAMRPFPTQILHSTSSTLQYPSIPNQFAPSNQ